MIFNEDNINKKPIITSQSDQVKTSELFNIYLNKNYEKISIIKFINFMKSNNIQTINKKVLTVDYNSIDLLYFISVINI